MSGTFFGFGFSPVGVLVDTGISIHFIDWFTLCNESGISQWISPTFGPVGYGRRIH